LPVWLGWARLAIGLAQGFGLYLIKDLKDHPHNALESGLWVTLWFVPVLIIGSLGALRWLTLAVWATVAALIAFGFAYYDIARLGDAPRQIYGPQVIYLIVPAVLFIGHHLVAAGDEARRWIAPYERYFDLGWRHGAQVLLAVLFTGVFWLMLWLGAALFDLINLHFLRDLLQKEWFAFPAICGAFAAAIHLTDLRSGLVRGARGLGLVLLSWLLPAMTLIAGAFILALPFTGLEPLWATRAATAILLSAAGALVVLINAAYQDGEHEPGLIRHWSARVAAVLLTPLAVLAAYALYLRIAQYGLTPDRVYAFAVLVVGLCYAAAYTIGAFWPRWLKTLEIGNVVAAFVVIGVALLLFTPIADPARLSVDNQLARLRAGITRPDQFDVAFLRFDGAVYGQRALEQLRADRSTDTARQLGARAQRVTALDNQWEARDETIGAPMRVTMYPQGTQTPSGFIDSAPYSVASMCARVDCDGFLVDVTNDGRNELIVGSGVFFVFTQDEGHWRQIGSVQISGDQIEAMRAGHVRAAPAQISDLMFGEDRVPVRPDDR